MEPRHAFSNVPVIAIAAGHLLRPALTVTETFSWFCDCLRDAHVMLSKNPEEALMLLSTGQLVFRFRFRVSIL